MSYSLAQLKKDNEFASLQAKASENLIKFIYSTTSDFTILQNFILNWINYITNNPDEDPSGNLLNILTNSNETQNNINGGIGDGIWDEIQYGKTNLILSCSIDSQNIPTYYYPFIFLKYITSLTSSDSSYKTIIDFFNELIAL